MAKAYDKWTVLEHGPIEVVADNLWRIEGSLPNMPLRRVMTVVRTESGDLLIHNGIALNDDAMKRLEEWGIPRYLIVPNAWHRLDARVWKDRFPALRVIAPRGALTKVEEVLPVDSTYDEVPLPSELQLEHLDGLAQQEGVLRVRSSDGVTLVFNDVIFNMPNLPGMQGLVMRLLGSSGGPRVTRMSKMFVVKDRKALRAHLERLASDPDLRRIIVSHHQMIITNASETLRAVAASL